MARMTFVHPDGSEQEVEAPNGISVLEAARMFDVPIEGACEGSLACSTCHVVVDEAFFDELPEATEDEEDMLDLAFGLKPTSRLGCQIILSDELDGLKVALPSATRNVQAG